LNERSPKILLVLDDEATVCRSLQRVLGKTFDEILTAETPADAETILGSRAVTHLLCDHLLGPGQPTGHDLATRWRAEHPSLEQVVLLTGADVSRLEVSDAIDRVLPKTTELPDLARALDRASGSR
jgi:CheY-like chemotaxis protein